MITTISKAKANRKGMSISAEEIRGCLSKISKSATKSRTFLRKIGLRSIAQKITINQKSIK